jgi:hypothetical protein
LKAVLATLQTRQFSRSFPQSPSQFIVVLVCES